MRIRESLWIGLLLSGCTGPCVAVDDASKPPEPAAAIRLQIEAQDRDTLELVAPAGTLSLQENSGRVGWVATGARTQWLHRVELSLAVNRLAPGASSLDLASSRCRVRYLDGGRETEADFSVDEAEVLGLTYAGGQWTAQLRVRCRKQIDTRSDGKSYAASLPSTFIVEGTGWARSSLRDP